MSSVQRWYIYIISAISLQGVTWATISLLRNLIIYGGNRMAIAFQIAVIIIGLPVYLGHWLWARSFVVKSLDERETTLRHLYLYGMMAGFLEPFIANGFDLINRLLGQLLNNTNRAYDRLSIVDGLLFNLIPLIILAVLWYYHYRVNSEDSKIVPETGNSATVRRLYVLGFSAAGLGMAVTGLIRLMRWIMLELSGNQAIGPGNSIALIDGITWLLIGTTLWIVFWRLVQQLFQGPNREEHNSVLRKIYLYGAILLGALDVVGNLTGILASLIRKPLIQSSTSGTSIYQPLSIIIGMGLLWLYHALVLREDTKQAEEAPRQAGVRRIYLYLIAGVGFAALLVGLCGEFSVVLRTLEKSFGVGLREQFAWYTAAIIAGLSVWIIPWRQVQVEVSAADIRSADARRSLPRKIYLYFFLFVATMTVFVSLVYIVYRILSMILGEPPPTLTELGYAISFSLIAVAVGVYHLRILRADRISFRHEEASLLEALHMVVVDVGEGHFGNQLVDRIKREFSGISLTSITLPIQDAETEDTRAAQNAIPNQLANAGIIIGTWAITIPGGGNGAVSPQIAQAVLSSSARKLLVPFSSEGCDWAGVDRWDEESFLQQTINAIKQVLAGETVKAHHPMGAGAIIGIIIGGLIVSAVLTALIVNAIY